MIVVIKLNQKDISQHVWATFYSDNQIRKLSSKSLQFSLVLVLWQEQRKYYLGKKTSLDQQVSMLAQPGFPYEKELYFKFILISILRGGFPDKDSIKPGLGLS